MTPEGQLIATAKGDPLGSHTFRLEIPDGNLEVIGRKLGYARASAFFPVSAESATVRLTLRRLVQRLATVRVTAEEDLRRKSYYIDADGITDGNRTLIDATDIVSKLRPDMLKGRSQTCALTSVWINGERIIDPPVNDMVVARVFHGTNTPRGDIIVSRGLLAGGSLSVLSVLATVQPQHISEMRYIDCLSPSLGTRRGTTSALFINLKAGVAFEPGRGTFVIGAP